MGYYLNSNALLEAEEYEAMIANIIFQEYGIIDVTNFDATPENPEVGYLCGGIVAVFSDGKIIINDANEGNELLEEFHVCDLIRMNSNINSFDPDHMTEIALMTRDKSIRIAFTDIKEKQRLVEALENLNI